jgi:hypothetical protein
MKTDSLAIAILLAIFASPAFPQAWPAKPIRVIVPYPPGGGTDINRALAYAEENFLERPEKTLLILISDLFEGGGSAPDVYFCTPFEGPQGLRFTRTEAHRRDEQRYRRTLASIQEILRTARVA